MGEELSIALGLAIGDIETLEPGGFAADGRGFGKSKSLRSLGTLHVGAELKVIEDQQGFDCVRRRDPGIFNADEVVTVFFSPLSDMLQEPVNTLAVGRLKSTTTNLSCS